MGVRRPPGPSVRMMRRSVQFDYSAQVEHFAQMMNRTAPATIGACCLPRHARHAVQQQAAAGAPRVCRGQLPCCSRAVPGRRPRGKTATSGKTSSEGLNTKSHQNLAFRQYCVYTFAMFC